MPKNQIIFLPVLFVLIAFSACRKSDYWIEETQIVVNDNGLGVGTTTWSNNKEYILEGKVYVNDGQILTIEPGTVIRARQGSGTASSALIVARGGKIIADGTAVEPIIFTVEGDNLDGSIGVDERGLWGGIIILGSASINTPTGEAHIEGIPVSEPRGIYGGNNDQSNSGVMRYVSIRYGGTDLGQGNEINGLTLGGVGSETIIDHIEVFANADDGIELFGGTVNLSHIVVANCADDAVDIDYGYRGNGQFWCLVQASGYGDKLIEIDGGEASITSPPYSLPVIFNVSAVGRGADYTNSLISFNDNGGGTVANSLFVNQKYGVEMEFSSVRHNSFTQWKNGKLEIKNCVFNRVNANQLDGFFSIYALNEEDVSNEELLLENYFNDAGNRFAAIDFSENEDGISLISDDEILFSDYALITGDDFFETANYIGAFDDYNWLGEWTLTSSLGLIW